MVERDKSGYAVSVVNSDGLIDGKSFSSCFIIALGTSRYNNIVCLPLAMLFDM